MIPAALGRVVSDPWLMPLWFQSLYLTLVSIKIEMHPAIVLVEIDMHPAIEVINF